MTDDRTRMPEKGLSKPKLVALDGCTVPPDNTSAEQFYSELEIDVLARTMWGEARGQGDLGLMAVAHVVVNRRDIAKERGRYWWGNSIIQVCQKPYQFSCWNRSDPNFKKLNTATLATRHFATCIKIARAVLGGATQDPTVGATHYHANYVDPYWAKDETPTIIIGDHIFYKLV